MSDFDVEPVPGLPALPPKGEMVLWRGSPDWRALAIQAFHVRKVAIYFGLVAAWKAGVALSDSGGLSHAFAALSTLAVMAVLAVALLTLLAWATARATVYTVTNRRVVLRIGVALPITFNLPFTRIDGVALKADKDGTGDIPLVLAPGERLAYAVMWPHVRPWRFTRPQPMLRAVPEAATVARLLGRAIAGEAPVRLAPREPVATRPAVQPGVAVPAAG